MFSLLYGFYEIATKKLQYNILIVGLDGAGKTSLLEKIKEKFTDSKPLPKEKITPTIGLNGILIVLLNLQVCKFTYKKNDLTVWDLGGKKNLRSIWNEYFADSHAILFVIDANDAGRFEESKEVFDEILENKNLGSIPILILLNKCDTQNKSQQEILELFELDRIEGRDWMVQCVSAENGKGIGESLEILIQYLQKNARYVDTEAYI
eukprot:gene10625-3248_t